MNWIMQQWRNLTGRKSAPYLVPVSDDTAPVADLGVARETPQGVKEVFALSVHNSAVHEALTIMYRDMKGDGDHD